jgi:uncharacterized SAM-binding protein YcdF (DUF218 family)
MLFVLKKVVGALLLPLPMAVVLAALGLLALSRGWRRLGKWVVACGAAVALLPSLSPVSDILLRHLERQYSAVLDARALRPVPRYVLVLGSGYQPVAGLPITAALDADSLVRLTEGVRLFKQLPAASLVVSGGALPGRRPSARGYADAAIALGVPVSSIIVLDKPLDTAAEARAAATRFGSEPMLLVTSAAHMPRAMAHCARAGVRAIAAPTGHLVKSPLSLAPRAWLPSAVHLRKTEVALHEYLGLAAMAMGAD